MTPIKHLLHIKSKKEEVFSALSKPDKISKWYTTIVKGEFKLDQIVIFEFVNFASFKFKITEYVQDQLISMECVESDMPVVGHVMKYEIDENDGKSRVRYSYNGFLEMDDSYANMNFSSAKYLESLRQFCQTGIGEAFGSDNYRS
tara:strand:- start:116 stop:550 length:435 start_codon:yes stop_codon:yes gene_type:complete